MKAHTGVRPPSSRHIGRVVVASIVGGLIAADPIVAFVVPGAAEHVITGSVMLVFGLGWALLATLSRRFTDQPQRWAVVPAAYMIVVGGALLAFVPSDGVMSALGWVWPPLFLALAVWMILQVREHLHSRTRLWLVYPVCVAMALAAVGGGYATVREGLDSGDLPRAASSSMSEIVGST